jgi:hypothetical protein
VAVPKSAQAVAPCQEINTIAVDNSVNEDLGMELC